MDWSHPGAIIGGPTVSDYFQQAPDPASRIWSTSCPSFPSGASPPPVSESAAGLGAGHLGWSCVSSDPIPPHATAEYPGTYPYGTVLYLLGAQQSSAVL